MTDELILRATNFCPFCHSCRLVLAEKEIQYRIELLDLERKDGFLDRLSPYNRVPVLVHNGTSVFESSIINEYLEESFPSLPLVPQDAIGRATVRFWVDFVQTRIVPAYFGLMNAGDGSDWDNLRSELAYWFVFVDRQAFNAGYFVGESLSLADFSLYPWIERLISAERYRDFSLPEECHRIIEWIETMQTFDAVQRCAKSEAEYIEFFDQFWEPVSNQDGSYLR